MFIEQRQQAGGWTPRESLLEGLEEATVSKLGSEGGDCHGCMKTTYYTQMEGMSGAKAQRSAVSKSQGEGWQTPWSLEVCTRWGCARCLLLT